MNIGGNNMANTINKISAHEITKIYPHPNKKDVNFPVFAGASFIITSESINYLLGSSGSGKTTLLRMLHGIEKINAGELIFNDVVINSLSGKERITYLKDVGYMDQFPSDYLSTNLTVAQNLDYSLLLHQSLPREIRKKKIDDIATKFHLSNLLQQKTLSISGGEMRRLGLACSIIFQPKILLCDEPTAQLDNENKKDIMKIFHEIVSEFNPIILIVTHDNSITDPKFTLKIVDRRIQQWS